MDPTATTPRFCALCGAALIDRVIDSGSLEEEGS